MKLKSVPSCTPYKLATEHRCSQHTASTAGQCRHTYASQLLTTGIASIDWIAEQMGHTNGNMIRQHYGTWINEDGPDVVGMLQLALKLSPATA